MKINNINKQKSCTEFYYLIKETCQFFLFLKKLIKGKTNYTFSSALKMAISLSVNVPKADILRDCLIGAGNNEI